MNPLEFVIPNLHMSAMAPILVIFAGAAVGMLVEAFVARRDRFGAQIIVTLVTILAALISTVRNWAMSKQTIAAGQALSIDGPACFLWTLILIFSGLSVLLFSERKLYNGVSIFTPLGISVPGSLDEREAIAVRNEHTEVYPLALFATAGMLIFCAANDLLTLFVALEVMSLPLYVLAGLARRRRLLSQESALKYFLLGSLSSAFFLYGIALTYGFSGSFNYSNIGNAVVISEQKYALLIAGIAFMCVGLLFKIGAVPFHNWTPDVYQGAPTPVTAFFASCTKIAAVGALLRLLYSALGAARWDWQPLIAAVAAVTIVVGSLLALTQTDMKRMLAYSSVAHAGFLLAAIVGATTYATGVGAGQVTSVSAVLFYLATYGFATLGAFAIVTMVRTSAGEANTIESWSGMGRKNPFLGLAMSVFLMSFAGLPLTAGFIGKWAVFASAWRGGFSWLVIVAVLASLVSAYFYLRIILVMFATDSAQEKVVDGGLDVEVGRASLATWIPIVLGFVMTLALGLVPGPLMDLATRASQFLH